jgi:hypothetical protein
VKEKSMAADLNQASSALKSGSVSGADAASGASPAFEVSSTADAQRFAQSMSAARENFAQANQSSAAPVARVGESKSVGNQLMSGLSDLSGKLKGDHKHISNMIEHATMNGDPGAMTKAMTLLADYQTRVQLVSKVISKASTSLDSLTRLQ